jgi:hypothetical protein
MMNKGKTAQTWCFVNLKLHKAQKNMLPTQHPSFIHSFDQQVQVLLSGNFELKRIIGK